MTTAFSLNEYSLTTPLSGEALLANPILNKGTAFSKAERAALRLTALLPHRVETIEEQLKRCRLQLDAEPTDLAKNRYLNELFRTNQTLCYRFVQAHLTELLPIIYTPIVGDAVMQFSREFVAPHGLFLSYPDADQIDAFLAPHAERDLDIIVVTDAEGILGLGDQGVGGIEIPIGKLMVYTLCAGIHPFKTLAIQLDVGTNNETLLNDPFYLGWRHPRLEGAEYDAFIERFVTAVKKYFPNVFLHWEDFGRNNATRILQRYQNEICTFNDDVQGTAVVTLAALLSALKRKGEKLSEQQIVLYGAGSAGIGICDLILSTMMSEGLTETEARKRFWLIDRPGLLVTESDRIHAEQRPYLRQMSDVTGWTVSDPTHITLEETISNLKPTVLIGSSTQAGSFTEKLVRDMASHVEHPIIFPLSNPSSKSEAHPQDILNWTNGKALMATGSPFGEVQFSGKTVPIAQCNNALVYPAMGLGIIASRSKRMTAGIQQAACQALASFTDKWEAILPPLGQAREMAPAIAFAVAKRAMAEGHAEPVDDETLRARIQAAMWEAKYLEVNPA